MMADSRNFHCWSYWRLLVDLMGLSAEDQEAYVLGRIEDNFSNYSAWHERTRVLQHLNMERPTLSLAELLAADSKHCCSSESSSGFTGLYFFMYSLMHKQPLLMHGMMKFVHAQYYEGSHSLHLLGIQLDANASCIIHMPLWSTYVTCHVE